jgi:hypothetical protein
MAAVCPKCHQLITVERLGVRLTPLKARIVDAIKAAGDIGISSQELRFDLYRDYETPRSKHIIRNHVYQINGMLEAGDWLIVADPRKGANARWHLRRRTVRRVA